MKGVRKLSLRPYHGTVWLCESPDVMLAAYKRIMRAPWPHNTIHKTGGHFCMLEADDPNNRVFLVYGDGPAALAHEFSHVLLIVFRTIGHDPREGDGEPFCYMLSQLMIDAEP